MSNLVHILPPLRQSMVETAACPRAYVEMYLTGKTQTASAPSERGTDIHHVMSEYVRHCAALKIKSDWPRFNQLAAESGSEAGPILDGIRDRYEVNFAEVYGTEITLGLDEDFNPCYIPSANSRMPWVNYSPHPAELAYVGTLDVIELSSDGTFAKIPDYKSHFAIFDADTFQSTLYPFMLFKHFPDVSTIEFELDFVRYSNCKRSVTWTRDEMPDMQRAISRARARQRKTHEQPGEALALPCKVCAYCPLAKALTCPIADWNEYTLVNNQQRLMALEFYRRMSALHRPVLKNIAGVTGNICYEDGNGKVYEYGQIEVPETRYPLEATTIKALSDWSQKNGENLLDGRLNVSSTKLKSLLKAKKRAELLQIFEDSIIERTTKPKWSVRTPEGVEEDYNPHVEE